MALITQAIKGTQDALPADSYKLQYVEQVMRDIAGNYGFKEIRTPVFEHTELFQRGVGDTTDVVQKEMYTFLDKGDRSVTLRPEGTAGAIRAFLEHGLFNEPLPQKLYYLTSCYRYEKPQAGRLREFHQFGVECVGTASPAADAEVISLAADVFDFLGVDALTLEINSIGCPECRKEYHKALKEYFSSHKEKLCETCLSRLEKNPMRILDCKSPVCSEIAEGAPKILDFLCDDCREHFENVKRYLSAMGLEYTVNPTIVRGLDYYTRTVFEFVSNEIGAQGTVCGGGRYDGLCRELGGNDIPSLGFGLGIERLVLLMNKKNIPFPEEQKCNLYIVAMGERASLMASSIAREMRQEGLFVLFDVAGRSVKAQMKYANKIGAQYTVVIGDSEIGENKVRLKNMSTGEETEIMLAMLIEEFEQIVINQQLAALQAQYSVDDADMTEI